MLARVSRISRVQDGQQLCRHHTGKILALLVLLCGLASSLMLGWFRPPEWPAPVSSSSPSNLGKLPLSFEPNVGQAGSSVHFVAHMLNGTLLFSSGEVALS